jgi:hypothetical protein
LDLQAAALACFLARCNAGMRMPINKAMMAMTTSSSINVKAFNFDITDVLSLSDMVFIDHKFHLDWIRCIFLFALHIITKPTVSIQGIAAE